MKISKACRSLFLGALLCVPIWASAQTVDSFTVINADTGADIATFTSSGTVSASSAKHFRVRANASSAKSVVFTDAISIRTESAAPYTYSGTSSGVYKKNKWIPAVGTYVIQATPFSGTRGTGTAGAVAALTLTITGATTPTTIAAPAPTVIAHAYLKNSGPDKNPLKGWGNGASKNYPEATVGFTYISWEGFEPTNGVYDFAYVEDRLSKPGTLNRHVVIRLFCDWKITDAESNCPKWLYTEMGVNRIQGDNNTHLTDYNNPNFVKKAVQAIQALATKYNDDPRFYSVELGILGSYGEWHTSGFRQGGVGYQTSDATKNTIINAYKTNFNKVKIQGRQPYAEPLTSTGGIGFHNDYFVPNNKHHDQFDNALIAGGQWLNGPIGGQSRPNSSIEQTDAERYALYATPEGARMIAAGHYSWLTIGAYKVEPGDPYYDAYMKLHRMMGYNFQIESANFPDSLTSNATMPVALTAKNIGVAPLYFDWQVQFALLDNKDQPVILSSPSFRLTTVKPGDTFTLSSNLLPRNASPGNYRLAVRIIQPGADAVKPAP
ncbi:MAG: hypothetical protein ACI8WM_002247, partial [Burkholderiaceae bacterium]